MKKVNCSKSTNKKNKQEKKYSNSKGFTLIEILVTMAILSIIFSIVVSVAINVVNSAKEKSYQVTINNIQNEASNYLLEGVSSVNWIDSNTGKYQYQCVSVAKLIEAGHFKGDVLDSEVKTGVKVKNSNYVYLERDPNTNSITKKVLLYGDGEAYAARCNYIKTSGNIIFNIEPSGWSKQKKITITYKLNNSENSSKYKYSYNYFFENGTKDKGNSKDNIVFPNSSSDVQQIITVTKNGDLIASISNGMASKSLSVDKIDTAAPVISITSTNNVSSSQVATLKMKDVLSGVSEYYFGKTDPSKNEVVWVKYDKAVSNITEKATVDSAGRWYLGAKDVAGNVKVTSAYFYRTSLSVPNATVTPTSIITKSGNQFTIPNAVAKSYYTFNGWYTTKDYSESSITEYKPTKSTKLYGKTTENKLTGGVVSVSGNVIYGETLTANITSNTTPKADKYTYQWYMNSSNSTSGGTKINGATSNKIVLGYDQINKYIYVVVTASKNNYRSTTFSNKANDKVAKRAITVTADSNSKVYDGKALTDSGCTAVGLLPGDTVTCTMTSKSKITNVGSVDNVISKVSVKDYYTVTKVNGKLTVTKKGIVIPTASVYCKKDLIYNGSQQVITNNAGTGYTFSNNKKTNAGTYSVVAKLGSNYIWNDGTTQEKNISCSIGKATPTLVASPNELNLSNTFGTSTYSYSGNGNVTCKSSATSVASCSINKTTKKVNVTPGITGTSTITLTAAETTNYLSVSDTISVNVKAIYTIKYNNGGSTGTMTSTTCTYGSACSVGENKFTKSGYVFSGWTTKSDGSDDGYNWTGWSGTWKFQNGQKGISNYTLTLYPRWVKAKKVYIKYAIQYSDEKLDASTANGSYKWVTDSKGIVHFDTNKDGKYDSGDKVLTTTINYGEKAGTDGLPNYNNSNYLNITRTGYSAVDNSEWKCISGECNGKVFSHHGTSKNIQYSASDFCDASKVDCTVILGVNWIGKEYTITYVSNGGYSGVAANNASYCDYDSSGSHDVTGTMTTKKCRYGETCVLDDNKYIRQCHNFKGWTTNIDTDTKDYTNSITPDNDSDAFYGNKDSFVYNKLGNMTLYAVWESEHKWNAMGVQLTHTGGEFECGHVHTTAYTIYCSVCQMSALHYNKCYLPSYVSEKDDIKTKICPCNGGYNIKFNDHALFNSSGSKIIPIYNDPYINQRGGIVEKETKFANASSVNNVCTEHYYVTFDPNGGSGSVQTKTIKAVLDSGSFPTTSRTGYTFQGWYTAKSGGTKYTIDTLKSNQSSNVTLYARWKDTSNPTCTISLVGNTIKMNVYDNVGVISKGLNDYQGANYNGVTQREVVAGTFYGYVMDADGNKGSCSIEVRKKTNLYTCSNTATKNYSYVSCNASNINSPSTACSSGKIYSSNTCKINKKYEVSYATCFYDEANRQYTWRNIGVTKYNQTSCSVEVIHETPCSWEYHQNGRVEYISSCKETSRTYSGTIACYTNSCSSGKLSGGKCYLYNQSSCNSGWTSTSAGTGCTSGYTAVGNYCYK